MKSGQGLGTLPSVRFEVPKNLVRQPDSLRFALTVDTSPRLSQQKSSRAMVTESPEKTYDNRRYPTCPVSLCLSVSSPPSYWAAFIARDLTYVADFDDKIKCVRGEKIPPDREDQWSEQRLTIPRRLIAFTSTGRSVGSPASDAASGVTSVMNPYDRW